METQTDYSITLLLEHTPEEVFTAITNVRGWWSENINGNTAEQGDVFTYNFKDVHYCKIELTEVIPYKRIVWKVTENKFNFVKDETEWVNNRMIFEIEEQDNKTILKFTQEGLTPEYECYQICHDCWDDYLQNSFTQLLATGKGNPNPKEE